MNEMIWFLALVLVAGLLLVGLLSASSLGKVKTGRRGRLDRNLVADRWQAIMAGSAEGGAGMKNAIMEADKLLDYAMRESGFPGTTMGERLKSPQAKLFSDLNGIWSAHKLRNHFAHEVGADLVISQAKDALREFERGLKDLGAL
jgi:hypothetical protein